MNRAAVKVLAWVLAWAVMAGVTGEARAQADGSQRAAPARKPNVILIVADDLGYGDLSSYGAQDVRTPNIDSLGTQGARFTEAYVTAPMCSPSRAGILTGKYPQRFGHEFNPFVSTSPEFGLPVDQRTLADEMKSAGYTTAVVGKWHLGLHLPQQPQNRGFDEFFGFRGGRHIYFPDPQYQGVIIRNTERVDEQEYLTDAFSREAAAFVQRNQDKPFFLYLSYNAIHTPLQAPEPHVRKYAHLPDEGRRMGCAMISALDDGIGRVLEKLRELKLEENTLVFFVSDNGGQLTQNVSSNGILAGGKNDLQEGGIRVPMLMRWKGKVPAGTVYGKPVMSFDLFATAAAAAGVAIPQERPIDGVDLMPFVTGETEAEPHDALYWRVGKQTAIRKGKWKLIKTKKEPALLFDVAADPKEKRDLSVRQSGVVRRLERQIRDWEETLAEPLWPNPDDSAAAKSRRIALRQEREKLKAEGGGAKQSAEMEEGEDDHQH